MMIGRAGIWATVATLAAWAQPAAAREKDCIAARDHHASFKAILNPDPNGKEQFETVDRRSTDGSVAIVRWVDGQKRAARRTLHGAFTKLLETTMGGRRTEVAFAPSLDLATLFPLKPNTSAAYRVSIGRGDRFEPKFADVKVSVGGEREMDVGGCKLKVMNLTLDWQGTEPGDAVSKTTLAYAPALEYPIETTTQLTLRGRTVSHGTKMLGLEEWKP